MTNMENPSFTRGEYWLLESAAQMALPIGLLDEPRLEEALNKDGHGMSRAQLIETIHKLVLSDLVAVWQGDSRKPVRPSAEDIEYFLNESRVDCRHYYGLTEKGGACWEAFARPDWEWFVEEEEYDFFSDDDDVFTVSQKCMNKRHLDVCFRDMSAHLYDVEETSVTMDVVEPWQATYWKQLPKGYCVSFKCKDKPAASGPSVRREYLELCRRKWCAWT